MKKTLMMVAACALALAGCKKEETSTTAPETGTTITATTSASTKVAINSNVFSPEMDSDVDQVLWKEGDKLRVFELEWSDTGVSDTRGCWLLANTTAIEFTLSSGAGTKSGTFTTTKANALDPAKKYVALHAGNIGMLSGATSSGKNLIKSSGASGLSGGYDKTLSSSHLTNNKAWSEDAMCFYGVIEFVDGEPTVSFKSFTSMFEITIKTADGIPGFTVKKLDIDILKNATSNNASNNLIKWDEKYGITEDTPGEYGILGVTGATCAYRLYATFPESPVVTVGEAGQDAYTFRYPVIFRVSGNHSEKRDVKFTITSTSGKTWSVTKTKTAVPGATSVFDGGKTFVTELVVDKDLN